MSATEPAWAPEPVAIETEIDEVLAEFGGDARAAIRALLIDMTTLQLDANRSSSRGFLRGWFSDGARPEARSDEL
jgi:hypothetical protein